MCFDVADCLCVCVLVGCQGKSLEDFLKEKKPVRAMNKSINKALSNNRKKITSMVKHKIDSRQVYD